MTYSSTQPYQVSNYKIRKVEITSKPTKASASNRKQKSCKTEPPTMDRDLRSRITDQSPILPDEIIEDILSRVEVKSLLKFRSVSRSWRSLIDSNRFIKIHHQISTKKVISNNDEPKQYLLHSLLKEQITDLPPLVSPVSGPAVIGGCCNGLVCIVDRVGRYYLWNPASKICNELPKFRNSRNRCPTKTGFGWDESTGAYKVFAIARGAHCYCKCKTYSCKCRRGEIYSSQTNSWKTVYDGNLSLIGGRGQFVSGKLNWKRTMKKHGVKVVDGIVTFDLKSEVFGVMKLPCDVMARVTVGLGVLGGCLSCVFNDNKRVDVWVMKESWEKMAAISLVDGNYQRHRLPAVDPFWIGVDGEIVLNCGSSFLVYHPQQNVLKKIKGVYDEAHLYVESLVSPEPAAE